MEIRFHGHSCFELSEGGTTVLVDPFLKPNNPSAVAAWFALRRAEARHAIDQDYDPIAVAVATAVLLALPIFESTADVFSGLAGGVVGGLAGLAASALRPSE